MCVIGMIAVIPHQGAVSVISAEILDLAFSISIVDKY